MSDLKNYLLSDSRLCHASQETRYVAATKNNQRFNVFHVRALYCTK
jgi:hypothetical protein